MLSCRAICEAAMASAQNLGWQKDDRWLLNLSLAHIGGLSILVRCLLARRCVVLGPPGPFDPDAILYLVKKKQVTLLSVVPTILNRLLESAQSSPAPESIRAMLLGGASSSVELLQRAAEYNWPVLTTYGLTEACSQVATQPYGTVNRGELGAGYPLAGMQVRIKGEAIQLKSSYLFSGYHSSFQGSF